MTMCFDRERDLYAISRSRTPRRVSVQIIARVVLNNARRTRDSLKFDTTIDPHESNSLRSVGVASD